jgi:hypothetical protein
VAELRKVFFHFSQSVSRPKFELSVRDKFEKRSMFCRPFQSARLKSKTVLLLQPNELMIKVARYSYHKYPAQESWTQNRVTIFTRRSRKLINKIKELPKWPDLSSCSRHITPLYVFYSVLCQLLMSLEFSILEKQCAISLFFVWWPMFKFCMLYCTAKNFHYTKNKKIV